MDTKQTTKSSDQNQVHSDQTLNEKKDTAGGVFFQLNNALALIDLPDGIDTVRLTCGGRRVEITNLEREPKVSIVDASGVPAFHL